MPRAASVKTSSSYRADRTMMRSYAAGWYFCDRSWDLRSGLKPFCSLQRTAPGPPAENGAHGRECHPSRDAAHLTILGARRGIGVWGICIRARGMLIKGVVIRDTLSVRLLYKGEP